MFFVTCLFVCSLCLLYYLNVKYHLVARTGKAWHGGYQAGVRHGTAGEGRDRRVARVRRPARGTLAEEETSTTWAGTPFVTIILSMPDDARRKHPLLDIDHPQSSHKNRSCAAHIRDSDTHDKHQVICLTFGMPIYAAMIIFVLN